MTLITVCAILGLIWTGPDSDLRRDLRRLLVERPAEMLQTHPLQALARLLALLAIVGFALGAPELLLAFGLVDLGLIMEVAATAILLAGVVRLRGWRDQTAIGRRTLLRRLTRAASRRRGSRSRRRVPPPQRDLADNDDDPGAAAELVAA